MSDPVYSLITDLNGNGPCLAPYPYHDYLVAMLTPCPFEDKDIVPDSELASHNSTLSYGRGFLKVTSNEFLCYGKISFRLKHNGENRIIRVTKSATSQLYSNQYDLSVHGVYSPWGNPYLMDIGDNILIPPYYRYQLHLGIGVTRLPDEDIGTEIWIKAEIL